MATASRLAYGHQQLAVGAHLHHGGAIRGGDPDVVLSVDRHPVCLVLIADDVLADLTNQSGVGVELEQLRLADWCALEDPEISFRIERHGRDSAITRRKDVRV